MLTQSDKIQEVLNHNVLQLNQVQSELDYCKQNITQQNTSNYLLEQSIPTKTENYWLWFSTGIIGGFMICQLLNL